MKEGDVAGCAELFCAAHGSNDWDRSKSIAGRLNDMTPIPKAKLVLSSILWISTTAVITAVQTCCTRSERWAYCGIHYRVLPYGTHHNRVRGSLPCVVRQGQLHPLRGWTCYA
ncbi:unnamed protein product [Choristocarpus tenellus]